MDRTNLFFKVVIEHERDDQPERMGIEIARQIMKTYGVRFAELISYNRAEE